MLPPTPLKPSWRQYFTGTLGAPLALFGIVVLFYWKLVLTNQYTWLEAGDIVSQVLPWFQFQAGEWHKGRFPMWDPTSWFGQPLFGQGQPGQAYPLNWLLFLAPLKNGWMRQSVLHWYFVLIRYLAALNAYALCRSLNRSRLASLVGGCVYGLGGYIANTDWPQMVNGAAWSPLVFLFLFRAERGVKPWSSALLSGFFLGFGWLAGHHQMNLLVSLAAAALWIWICLRDKKIDWRVAKLATASMAIAALASTFQTLPMAEYGQRAVRWVGSPEDPVGFAQKVPYSVHAMYALSPENLLGIFIPGAGSGFDPFVGVTALAFAFLGFALAWRTKEVRWLAAIGLGGVLYCLGGDSLFHGLMYALVPLVEKSRVPAAGTLLISIGLAPLCAFGIDLIPEAAASTWTRRVTTVLAGIALIIVGVAIVGYLRKLPDLENRILLTALAASLAAVILTGWRMQVLSTSLGAVAALGLILFELSNVSTFYWPNIAVPEQNKYLHYMGEHGDLVDFIRSVGVGSRVQYTDDITYSIGDWYGIESINGYGASVLDNVWHMDLFSKRGLEFFGVRYFLGKKPLNANQVEVFRGKSGVKVFENPSAYPRAWSVHEVKTVANVKEAHQSFSSKEFDPQTSAILVKQAPALESCSNEDDSVLTPIHQPNFIHIQARLECRGMIIVTDSFFPGWRATVDGKSTPIYEVDGGVRGIVVEKGAHEIDMRYRPWTVFAGGAMTLFAAALVALVCARERS
jgi:hypothetical protein